MGKKQPDPQYGYGTTVGVQLDRPNRNTATPNAPPSAHVTQVGQGDRQTEAYTLFTLIGQQASSGQTSTPTLYNADRLWGKVTVTMETAGPVAVSTRADLFPVLSGKGVLLATGVPSVFNLGKGSKLYYAANALNRLNIVVEPYPWLEQIVGNVDEIRALLKTLAGNR